MSDAGFRTFAGDRVGPWWRHAVIYEVYPRSFADSDADGVGDLTGLRSRLPYLAELGVDAIWIAPWYPSPMADGGYDITDHRDVHPVLGSLGDAETLIASAHELGIRVIVDLVANHTSSRHPWFELAVAAGPGSPERDRYLFRDGVGPNSEQPPNNWRSAFGNSAWTRTTNPDGYPGQWYLHTFAAEQPDLNWRNASVAEYFDSVLTFWLDRGADGIRVDAAPAMVKAAEMPDADYPTPLFEAAVWVDNPHWDRDEVHTILRRWRSVADRYDGERMFIVEAVVNGQERLARYLRADEMHAAFNFPYLASAWTPQIREIIDDTLAALTPVGATATWVLSSHDELRVATRYGRARTSTRFAAEDWGAHCDLELGRRRARAAALLQLALPGIACLYQGDELGLPEVEDLPEDLLEDPVWRRSGKTVRGRDGCRVPMPWRGDRPPFGFTDDDARPWLPQPADWRDLTVERQAREATSMLSMYRTALQLRRQIPDLRSEDFAWRPAPAGVLYFDRGPTFRCLVNLSRAQVRLADDETVLLTSQPLERDKFNRQVVEQDTAIWLSVF